MDKKERHGKRAFNKSILRAKETAQEKRRKLAEESKKRADEAEAERVRTYNRKQCRLLGEKFDED